MSKYISTNYLDGVPNIGIWKVLSLNMRLEGRLLKDLYTLHSIKQNMTLSPESDKNRFCHFK